MYCSCPYKFCTFLVIISLWYSSGFVQFRHPSDRVRKFADANIKSGDQSDGIVLRSSEWAKIRGMEPGFGGIWPGSPDALKYNVKIRSKKTGEVFEAQVPRDRYIFFVFEELGIDLPVINKNRMCRQGCCTICTVKVESGKVKMDSPLGLLRELRDQNYALSCCAYPRSDIECELQDEDEMYIRQWGEGFEGGGVAWGGFVPDDD